MSRIRNRSTLHLDSNDSPRGRPQERSTRSPRWRQWRREEKGVAEVAAAIFILPLLIALIFTLIEVSAYMRIRTMVDKATRDTTLMVAAEGANTAQRWSVLQSISGVNSWSQYGTEQLRLLCGNIPPQTTYGGPLTGTPSAALGPRCTSAPQMTCSPTALQPAPGVTARCESTFYYRPLTSLSQSPVFSLGFNGMLNSPIRIGVTSITSVGQGRL